MSNEELRDANVLYAIRQMINSKDPNPKFAGLEPTARFNNDWLNLAKKWLPNFTAPSYGNGNYNSADIRDGDILFQRGGGRGGQDRGGIVVLGGSFDRVRGTIAKVFYSVDYQGRQGMADNYQMTLDPPEWGNDRMLRLEATLRPTDRLLATVCEKIDP
ncbi:hypothetical protein [Bradyrhizobium guangdongense]